MANLDNHPRPTDSIMDIETTLIRDFGFNEFLARKLATQLGSESIRLAKAEGEPPKKSLRVNTLKTTDERLLSRLRVRGFELSKIDWVKHGYWIESSPNRPSAGATHEYLFGHYFLQSPVSMLIAESVEPPAGGTILDLAAGVGGKSTHLCQIMMNAGALVAVEPRRERVSALRSNLSRMGCTNAVVLQMDGRSVSNLGIKFDAVLLDAPCTATGLLGIYPRLKQRTTEDDLTQLQRLQASLLERAWEVLAPGGALVYSTCSLLKDEGEEVISRAVELGGKTETLPIIKAGIGFPHVPGRIKNSVRFYRHLHNLEGFFVCKIRKPIEFPS
jgi:NOL1/NOP2/sun family putative RNA methylase